MKINIPVRFKNVWFWVGLVGVVLTAMGVDASTFTSWGAVADAFIGLISNPYMLAGVAMAVLGVLVDPTTEGVSDSNRAMAYEVPKKEGETV